MLTGASLTECIDREVRDRWVDTVHAVSSRDFQSRMAADRFPYKKLFGLYRVHSFASLSRS